jgi:hypothetical protein
MSERATPALALAFAFAFALATAPWIAACGGGGRPTRGDWTSASPPPGEGVLIEDDVPPMVTAAPRTGAALAFEGTEGVTEKDRSGTPQARLAAVRTGSHDGFDRVVFEFEGSALPGYRVEYRAEPIRRCGSGTAADLAGSARVLVRMTPATAHRDKGPGPAAMVKDQERRLQMEALRELEMLCDFEGSVEWGLGLVDKRRYRVLELSSPPRLVVDVLHDVAQVTSDDGGPSP